MSETDDPLRQLEEKFQKAFDLFEQSRKEKLALRQDLEKLRAQSKDSAKVIDAQERELIALRREREEVRTRVEKLLQRIDALASPEAGG